MGYEIERLPGEPIVLITMLPPLDDPESLMQELFREVGEYVTDIDGIYYHIVDIRQLNLDFSISMRWLAEARNDTPHGPTDPRVRVATVTTSDIAKETAKWAQQEQYQIELNVFDTVDDALGWARSTD